MGAKQTEAWATHIAERIVANGGSTTLRNDARLGIISKNDRRAVQRIVGGSVDAFNARLSEKLCTLADKIANRMEEHLDGDRFKPGELSFALATVEDKRRQLDGRNALASGSVNVQINNYGATRSREEVLASIEGIDLPPSSVSQVSDSQQSEPLVPDDFDPGVV